MLRETPQYLLYENLWRIFAQFTILLAILGEAIEYMAENSRNSTVNPIGTKTSKEASPYSAKNREPRRIHRRHP